MSKIAGERRRQGKAPGDPWRHLGDVTCYEGLRWGVYWAGPYRLTRQRHSLRLVCQDERGALGGAAYRLTRRRRRWVMDADLDRITRGRPELLLQADMLVLERAGGGDGVRGYQGPWTKVNGYLDGVYRPRHLEGQRRLQEMREAGTLTRRWAVAPNVAAAGDLL